jgi:amino acid permease
MVLLQGHRSYVSRTVGGVIVAYIMLFVFVFLIVFWKWLHNETATPLDRINLLEGKRDIDIEEEKYEIKKAQQPPRPWYQRLIS